MAMKLISFAALVVLWGLFTSVVAMASSNIPTAAQSSSSAEVTTIVQTPSSSGEVVSYDPTPPLRPLIHSGNKIHSRSVASKTK